MILSHGRSIQKMEISKNTSQILPPEKRSHIAWKIWRLPWNTFKYHLILIWKRTIQKLGIEKNRWTTTTIIFNLFDKVIGQQQNSEEIEPGVKSKYGLLFVCFLQQPSQLLHLWTVSINKISTGFLPLKSIKFSYLKNPSTIPSR